VVKYDPPIKSRQLKPIADKPRSQAVRGPYKRAASIVNYYTVSQKMH